MVTPQEEFWKSEFGDEYTRRNFLVPAELDRLYAERFGVTRTQMNEEFLKGIALERILEVGANMGAQLRILQSMGFENLYGVEINEEAIEGSKKDSRGLNIVHASAFDIPFRDSYFDLVFTSGVLIHISPETIAGALKEIHRTAKKYIWGFEYFSEKRESITYRGHTDRLWKANFAKLYLDMFDDLRPVKEERFKYLADTNIDSMFLLEKK